MIERWSQEPADVSAPQGSRVAPARHVRVAAGLAELERWLDDQVRHGLAAADEREWAELSRRLVDAQAPGVAGVVGRLGAARSSADWPERLLEEYAMLRLLAVGYRRAADLPADLARSVRTRVGFPVSREEVLAGPAVRDVWHVVGRREETRDRLVARRVWLKGRRTGRAALVLSFAPVGHALDDSLVTGEAVDASMAFYPGASPLRALVSARHDEASTPGDAASSGPSPAGDALPGAGVAPGTSEREALDEVAAALAGDPWTESWPLVLSGVVPSADRLGGLRLHPRVETPWRLIAVSGGRPLTVAAEWTPRGLVPLTTWDEHGQVVIL
ncbi:MULTISPECIES: SWIM zinc finger family protein [Nonomuraea]|uniref:SWIM zinc finger family protein n=1 Tax=Nonomuraea mangrovi TaxID=2316207 RepID=A0ABW4SZ46_9ACTN